ncbi:tyrosine-type recombinase/integrase [Streptomyces sp. LZ34]
MAADTVNIRGHGTRGTAGPRHRDHPAPRRNAGTIPLVARYDYHELVTRPPLPHLFQRRIGWKRDVISTDTLYQLLNDTLARAALTDETGEPLHFTPHDFRRIFATEAVAGGLPIHIAARLLGHTSTSTTEAQVPGTLPHPQAGARRSPRTPSQSHQSQGETRGSRYGSRASRRPLLAPLPRPPRC